MLAARLRELLDVGVIAHDDGCYSLTEAGTELAGTVRDLGTWGQKWLSRSLPREELDPDALMWDIRRRIRVDALPLAPIVARIELGRAIGFLLLRRSEVSLCTANPGFPEELRITGSLRTLTAWWRGDISLASARSSGMVIEGRRAWVRAFPTWFERYVFADVESVRISY